MSAVSGASADFDFWEFVNCSVCHLEFVKESGALSSIPFWLSECGHVICNAHLSADQSCAACGSPGVQVIPLQRELEPPMANWFNSVPNSFDAVAYSLRFQMNTMATLVRYFKKKYQQYRPLYERLKEEHQETKRLRKMVDDLTQENKKLRQHLEMGGSDNTVQLNANGKRLRTDDEGYFSGQRTSSPRSASTPLGPDRLTLPPGHRQPEFNSRQSLRTARSVQNSKQGLEHYAYAPPQSAQPQAMAKPTVTHIQSGSARRAQLQIQLLEPSDPSMPPPPLPAKRLDQRASMDPRRRMPPPTPQPPSGAGLPPRPSVQLSAIPQMPSSGSQRFVPQTPTKATAASLPATPRSLLLAPQPSHTERFIPAGSVQRLPPVASLPGSGVVPRSGSVAQTPTRVGSLAVSTSGGQRTPFIPSN